MARMKCCLENYRGAAGGAISPARADQGLGTKMPPLIAWGAPVVRG